MNKPVKGDKFRHFKGVVVTVLEVAKHSETLEEMVIYEHDGEIWCRPMDLFMSKVDKTKYPDVNQEYRFQYIEETND